MSLRWHDHHEHCCFFKDLLLSRPEHFVSLYEHNVVNVIVLTRVYGSPGIIGLRLKILNDDTAAEKLQKKRCEYKRKKIKRIIVRARLRMTTKPGVIYM